MNRRSFFGWCASAACALLGVRPKPPAPPEFELSEEEFGRVIEALWLHLGTLTEVDTVYISPETWANIMTEE